MSEQLAAAVQAHRTFQEAMRQAAEEVREERRRQAVALDAEQPPTEQEQ